MALISIPAPIELSHINVPGKKEVASELHITLCYLGDNVTPENLVSAFMVTTAVCRTIKPFEVVTNYTTVFPNIGKGFPVICAVESPEVYDLRDKIANGLQKANVPFANNFIPYKPHVTLSFSPLMARSVPAKACWTVDQVNIWPHDKGNTNEISVPFVNKFAKSELTL